MSGAAVSLADECIRQAYRRMDRKRDQIVGSGGLFTPVDAYRRIKFGASLVQILTSLLYEGAGVLRSLTVRIAALLRRDEFSSVTEAIRCEAGAALTPAGRPSNW